MQWKPVSIRNRLMVACALVVACALAAPAAFARDGGRYHHSGDRSGNVLGALVVGAVIGGVLVGASQNHNEYYGAGYSYPPPPAYPPPGYYESYPAYSYGGYAYPDYGYGSGVSIGVVYGNGGSRYRYQDHRSYNRGYDRGSRDYSHDRRGRGDRGHYYQHRGH